MIPLAQLKQDMEFSKSLSEIVEGLKIGAAIELRHLQAQATLSEPFLKHTLDNLSLVDPRQSRHPFLAERASLPSCVVVITSEEGFSGELNALLVNAALTARDAARGDQLVVLGERGAAAMEELGESFVYFPGVADELDRRQVAGLQRHLVQGYLDGTFGSARVVYAKFLSVTFQRVDHDVLLPYRAPAGARTAPRKPCALEPSADLIVEELVSLWLAFSIATIFMSSKLSEVSARVMHLEGSDQELSQMSQRLSLQYVKHLHALADKSIREISVSRLRVTR